MIDLEHELRTVSDSLHALGLRFAVVGGLAVSTRSEPRLTRDADLAVAVADDVEAEAAVRDLSRAGYRVVTVLEQEATGRLATVRLARSSQAVVVDLLFASSGIEPEIVAEAELLELLPGLVLPVASIGHLLAMKLLARDDRRRPLDADDLRALRAVATDADWLDAERAVSLIMRRGYARNRDLEKALQTLRTVGAY